MSKIDDFENKMIGNGMSDKDFEEYKLMLRRVHDKWNKYQHCIHAARRFAPQYYQRAIFLIEYAVDNFTDGGHYSLALDPYEAMGDIYFRAKKYDKAYNSYLRAIDKYDDNRQLDISVISEMLLWAKLHLDDFQYSEEIEKYYNDFIKGSDFYMALLNSRFRRYVAELVIYLHNKNTEYVKTAYKNVCTVLAPDYKGELYDILRKHKCTESIETTDEVISFLKKIDKSFSN